MSAFDLPEDMDPRALPAEGLAELMGFVAATSRDAIPTLEEVKAASPMVDGPTGALVPERLADRDGRGWGDDADRDSASAAELARLVSQLDQMADDVVHGRQAYSAIRLANQWQAIRKITRGNGGK